MREVLEQILAAHNAWLDRQPLAVKTRITYRLQVHQYRTYLAQCLPTEEDPLCTSFACGYAIRDYKTHLKTKHQTKPTSVNLAPITINHLHRFIGNDRPQVQRESLPAQTPLVLKLDEQKDFLLAVERVSNARDQAIACLPLYMAIRLEECAVLNLDDVCAFAHKGLVILRFGKSDTHCEILRPWLKERTNRSDPAVFLNLKEKRLSARLIDLVIHRIGTDAQLEPSAHVSCHTCLTNRIHRGNDLVGLLRPRDADDWKSPNATVCL